ncbi:MAG: glycosyltransferase family 2 protein [Balneolales bacterium]
MYYFSIVIVTWNALHHLKRFLPSVYENSSEAEIIIADNASGDGSAEWVNEHYPDIKIITCDKNYGYCGGNNRGAAYASGEVILFLNNDVEVTPEWLDPIKTMFNEDKRLAAVQPKIRSLANKEYFEHAGAAGGFMDRYAYPFCQGRIFDHVEKDEGQYDEEKEIFWASGAALAIRNKVFVENGGFDEDFEFHMEEIDLCWRLWNRGYKVKLCPGSTVFHLGGGSLSTGSPRKIYYNYRNNLAMIIKNSSHFTILKRVLMRFLLDYIASLKALLSFRFGEFRAILKAQLHFLKDFDSLSRKRDELQQVRTNLLDPDTMIDIAIVKEYFLKGKRTFTELLTSNNTNKTARL